MPRQEVIRTYLELTSPEQFRPARSSGTSARLEPVPACPTSFFRYLYAAVGERYHWVDRSQWSDERIRAHLRSGDVSLWVLYSEGAPAGYFELKGSAEGSVEIAYFGLLPDYHGRGLGKHLLTLAVEGYERQARLAAHLHARQPGRVAELPWAWISTVQGRALHHGRPLARG
jgi:GNAT superfamily N-acetyltransferase